MTTSETPPDTTMDSPKKKRASLWFVFIFIVVISMVGIAIYFGTQPKKTSSLPPPPLPSPSQNDALLASLQNQLQTLEALTRELNQKNQLLEAKLQDITSPPPVPLAPPLPATTETLPPSSPTTPPETSDHDKTAMLEDKISQLEQALKRQTNTRHTTQLIVAAFNLREAIVQAHNFEQELEEVTHYSQELPFIQKHALLLSKHASLGIPTSQALTKDFHDMTNRILAVSREQKETPSLLNKVAKHLSHVVTIRKIDGDSHSHKADDIIARAEKHLKQHQLQPTIDELNHLEINLRSLAQPWIRQAQASLESQRSSKAILDHAINLSQASM